MSTLSVRLPESLHRHLRQLAAREGVSINQLISAAVGEKVAALDTEAYLAGRAKQGNRRAFDRALSRVPDVEPEEQDQLPNKSLQPTSRPRKKTARAKPARG